LELGRAGLTGRPHGAEDPAASRRDLRVGDAAQPLLPLLLAAPGEDHVGVRVDEAWNEASACRIERPRAPFETHRTPRVSASSHPDDSLAGPCDGAVPGLPD